MMKKESFCYKEIYKEIKNLEPEKRNKKNEFSLLSAEQVDFNNNLRKSKTIPLDIEIERYLDFNSLIISATTSTSVPFECLFSKSGELITNRRNRLKPELAEKLLLLVKTLLNKWFLYKRNYLMRKMFSMTILVDFSRFLRLLVD
ncbi:hypothetical protein BpHYR1_002650 [Brachionus plicatilis]|uniref:HAT C-terminal dimerisation domain-containing protein n=1 Tax=Brachionus plicatilis TaxID=10195 RepID=A0A3M7PE73_BRAPC|nr:hypothetical protein BpHYR1_002650 [Brachionus plicatilis]